MHTDAVVGVDGRDRLEILAACGSGRSTRNPGFLRPAERHHFAFARQQAEPASSDQRYCLMDRVPQAGSGAEGIDPAMAALYQQLAEITVEKARAEALANTLLAELAEVKTLSMRFWPNECWSIPSWPS